MHIIIFILYLFIGITAQGQSSITTLSAKLIQGHESNTDKVDRIYSWVTSNIQYDIRQADDMGDFHREQSAESVLQNKKGVCQGYSNLLHALLNQAGIPNYIILGDARTENDDSLQRHSWNAIQVDGTWHLVDATWDAGYIRDRTFVRRASQDYYLQQPADFIETHLPDDPLWQLLTPVVSTRDFYNKNYPTEIMTDVTVINQVEKFTTLSPDDQVQESSIRQLAYNPDAVTPYYDLGMLYFNKGNLLGEEYDLLTDNLTARSQWRQQKSTLINILTEQEKLIQRSFSNFDMLDQASGEYRDTAQKNKSILSSVLRTIKNEMRLLHDL